MDVAKEKSYLYYLGTEQDRLIQALNGAYDDDGNPTAEFYALADTLMEMQGKAPEVAMTAGSMVLELNAQIEAWTAAEKRAKGERQRLEKVRDALKDAILQYMDRNSVEKTTGMVKLSTRKSTAVEITAPEAIPFEYLRCKYEPDKTAIGNALKSGADVPGAALVTNRSLQVK